MSQLAKIKIRDINLSTSQLLNKNILDNSWFIINQRNAIVSTGLDGVDRWLGQYSITNGMIVLNKDQYLMQGHSQYIKNELNEQIITMSYMLSDGTVGFGTNVYYKTNTKDTTFIYDNNVNMSVNYDGYFTLTALRDNVIIKHLKVELGLNSTIKFDLIDNYSEELKNANIIIIE